MRVLFVCTGNICRSPAAHAVLERMVTRAGLAVEVDSAGLGGWHQGELPDPRARAEGARRGYALTHPARVVQSGDFQAFDLIIAMDRGHLRALTERAPPACRDRVRLFRSVDPTAPDADVADPYYDGPEAFAEMFDTIERCAPVWLTRLLTDADR